MKKRILSMALALIATGAVISAQTPQATENNSKKDKTEQCSKSNGDKKQKGDKKHKGDKKGPKMGKERHHGQHPNLFNGIELSDQQKADLKKMREQDKAAREQAKKERQALDQKATQERMAKRDEAIKKILTPEQYKQYQANVEAAKASKQQRGDMPGKRPNGDRKGPRHDRGERNTSPN